MRETKQIDLQDLEPFNLLSKEAFQKIKNESEILIYEFSQPLSSGHFINNKVLFILEGEARIIVKKDNKFITLGKINAGGIIGLGSILRAAPCEEISASKEIKALAIPDTLILELILKEERFKKWCNSFLFPSEIYQISKKILKSISTSNLDPIDAFELIKNNHKLYDYQPKSRLNIKQDEYLIVASANIENKDIGNILKNGEQINYREPFSPRIISIPKNIYESLKNPPKENKESTLSINTVDSQEKTNQFKYVPIPSGLEFGQNEPLENFDLITGKGDLQEALACLKMLAAELNIPFRGDAIEKNLRDVIRRGKKISFEQLASMISVLGLSGSMARIPIGFGKRLDPPCIVAWKDSFAMVLRSNVNGLILASPSFGLIKIPPENLKEEFGENIKIIIAAKNNQTPEKKFGFDWFWSPIKKYRVVLSQVLLASFVVQLFTLANPLLIQVIIDKVINQRSLDTLQILGFALVVVTILGGVLGSLRTFLFAETTNRIDTRLGAEVIDHLLRLPLNYFDKRPVGELGSRISELEKIREFLTGQALTTVLDAAFSIIYILVMVIYSWLLTFIALSVIPIQILITLLGTPLIRRQIRETAIENAKTQSHLVEVLTGVQTVKAQNVETISRWKWQDLYNKYITKTFERTITSTLLSQTSQVFQQLSQLFVLWIGASLVLEGKISLGQLIAFRIISGYVTQPLLRLTSIWQNIQELKVSFERLADIVDTPEESSPADKVNIPLPNIQGNIRFENINFKFNDTQQNILKNVNLDIPRGTFVGIVGQSGSGKSTLMKLLPRLYNIKEGRAFIDGYDIAKVELYSLRKQIGIVPQEPLLFAGSISENIALTEPNSPSDEIIKAAKIAGAHDFIMTLPQGYSTNIGERGASLSGGQKQRIAIARTILGNTKLLIMDEATSALDYNTEKIVCDGIKENYKDCTVFFITHRLSTVKNADVIVMMHDGRIEEVGTHDDLISKQGRYYALYQQQEK